jgi:hypothetical protein
LNEKLLRERCGDCNSILTALKFTIFKRVVGSEDIKAFLQKFIIDKSVEAKDLKRIEDQAKQEKIHIETMKIDDKYLGILPIGWDFISNDSLHLKSDKNLKLAFDLYFLKHPITANLWKCSS